MVDRVLTYDAPPTGLRFMASDARVRLIMGPVGSGKSTVSIMEVFRRCVEMPKGKDGFRRSRWVITRNTLPQLKTTTKKSWDQWFPDGVYGQWKETDKTFYLRVNDVEAEILFLPLDSPDDVQKLLSLELTGAFINEAREVAPEIIQAVISRLGRFPSRAMMPINPDTGKPQEYWYGLVMDTNPPSRDSFIYEQFEEEQPEGWDIFKQPGGLEPNAENRENLPDTYYEDMMRGADEDWVNVHVHGKYGRSVVGRPVFEKSFKRAFHVSNEPLIPLNSSANTVMIGMDFGRTPAAVLGQRDWRGRLNVLDALYEENIGLENFLKLHLKPLLRERFPHCKYLVIGDPAGWARSQLSEKNAFDVLRENGLAGVPASTNDIDKRLGAVEALLAQQIDGAAMFRFAPETTSSGMKKLIAGLDGGYRYKRRTDGTYEVTPQKNSFSHLADAAQYLALGANLEGGATAVKAREVEHVNHVYA